MVRLLSTCVVLVLVATLILDCEALRKLRRNKLCCVRRRCTVGSSLVRCCGRRRVCVGKRGFRKGHCRRVKCIKRGRDVEEPEEEEAEALDTMTADP
ncbi:hypothetical protein ACOMHN_019443 [Nucella lapillus]